MKRFTFLMVLLALVVVLTVPTLVTAQDSSVKITSADVFTHPSQGDVQMVEGAQATLFTTEVGATMSFRTDLLEDGHVYTAWWVIVNNPEACSATPCPTSEILGTSDLLQTEVTQADGILVSEEGAMEFAGFLAVGDVDVDEAWFGNGVTNPMGAEIHIVINDHGLLIPDMADTMLNTYRGGCQDEGLPPPFPPTAISDGEAGPNTCRLVQFAIFQQNDE
jgi:hypothetical protein